jgi:hypothetical protein
MRTQATWRELTNALRTEERRIEELEAQYWKMKAEKRRESELAAHDAYLTQERTAYLEAVTQLESMRVIRRAEKLRIPIPSMDDNHRFWCPAKHTALPIHLTYILTPVGMTELRSAIRAEKKERSELTRSWFMSIGGLIGACTGLIGAVIGLLSLIWRHQVGP